MAIVNYPERIFKTTLPAIDVVMGRNKTYNYQYSKDITAVAIDQKLSAERNWIANTIVLTFNNATARTFTVAIAGGRKIVSNYNDFLWVQCASTLKQKIVLDAGFYTGTELAAHLETKLDANTDFTAAGLTFTVAYDNATGLFTITPSSGNIRYIQTNNSQVLGQRDSIAGNLFGLSADTVFDTDVVSDIANAGLDSDSTLISQVGNTSTSYVYTTATPLSIDQALHFTTNTAATIMSINVNYSLEY